MAMPKWFRKEILPFYDAQPGIDWGTSGLIETALDDGSNVLVRVCTFNGSVQNNQAGQKVLSDIVEMLGVRVVNEDLNWDRSEDVSISRGRIWAVNDNTLVSITLAESQGLVQCAVLTTEEPVIAKLSDFFKANTHKEKVEEYIYAMVSKSGRIQFQRIGKGFHELERENYSEKVLTLYDRVVTELNSPKPRGRIAIFDGPPGTGKTYMVRAILNDVKGIHVMIPSHMVSSLADPSILPAIIDLKDSQEDTIVFIIEDGDEVIAPRGADNMPAISSVLNLGDGILGACLDIRVVITTNAKRAEMDEAMTRPGRLISIVHIGRLEPEEATLVFQKITGTEQVLTESMTLAEIYSKALDSGFQPVTAKQRGKMGFGS